MTTPPRFAERLLGALGAGERFREPLLGDLAEEFALRAQRDGVTLARRWYHREAARAAPHLLGARLLALDARAFRRHAGIVLAAWFFTGMCTFVVMGMVGGVMAALGLSVDAPGAALRAGDPVAMGIALALSVVAAVTGGWFAASLDEAAPLASALFLGIAWSSLSLAGSVVTHLAGKYSGPLWYRVAVVVVAIIGPVVGGMLQLRVPRAPSAVARS